MNEWFLDDTKSNIQCLLSLKCSQNGELIDSESSENKKGHKLTWQC